ncbi:MAG: phosphoribosyl-ATP diphosphatase [Planctomycetales bacterium]|nr:phosphoribosyl-ATP diphosphatase [Planctomycetales bacterium]
MNAQPLDILDSVMRTITERKRALPGDSYVATLLRGGIDKIGGKVIEEARELVDAAQSTDRPLSDEARTHLVHEAADLLFHTLVLLSWADLSLDDVRAELKRRHGTSGLVEKTLRSESQH